MKETGGFLRIILYQMHLFYLSNVDSICIHLQNNQTAAIG